MLDIAIIYIYTKKDKITRKNLSSIRKNNPAIYTIDICQKDFIKDHYEFLDLRPIKYWNGKEIWYWGSDNIFLHWYLKTDIKANNYLILEWDTFAYRSSVFDFFGKDNLLSNTGIKCAKLVKYKEHSNYHWFKEQKPNQLIKNLYGYDNFKCCTPLCGTLISDKCISSIVDHLKDNNFGNKLYVESKFATIGSYLGYEVEQFSDNIKESITYCTNGINSHIQNLIKKKLPLNGMYHPIKDISTINNYFTPEDIGGIPMDKIHKAIYGKVVDVKGAIEKLHSLNPQEKIEINNFLNGDPAHGVGKELYLTYEKNGQIYETVLPEKTFIDFDKL